jgi:hypothetical protein
MRLQGFAWSAKVKPLRPFLLSPFSPAFRARLSHWAIVYHLKMICIWIAWLVWAVTAAQGHEMGLESVHSVPADTCASIADREDCLDLDSCVWQGCGYCYYPDGGYYVDITPDTACSLPYVWHDLNKPTYFSCQVFNESTDAGCVYNDDCPKHWPLPVRVSHRVLVVNVGAV